MIDSGVDSGRQPGLEARRRPGWLGFAARGPSLPCFPALPGRMLAPGDTGMPSPKVQALSLAPPRLRCPPQDSGF